MRRSTTPLETWLTRKSKTPCYNSRTWFWGETSRFSAACFPEGAGPNTSGGRIPLAITLTMWKARRRRSCAPPLTLGWPRSGLSPVTVTCFLRQAIVVDFCLQQVEDGTCMYATILSEGSRAFYDFRENVVRRAGAAVPGNRAGGPPQSMHAVSPTVGRASPAGTQISPGDNVR